MIEPECLFCKIVQGILPSNVIKENEHVLVIEDIHPKAPIHYLIIPKKHIENINYLTEEDENISYAMLLMARDLSQDLGVKQNLEEPFAFNLLSNNGAKAGQQVFHMHWHFISGKSLYLDGSKL